MDREQLILDLEHRCARGGRRRFLRKKYAWLVVVKSSTLIKRLMDIAIASAGLIFLSPLLLLIAGLIKLQDGGEVFYVSTRIGKWGQPFAFPKFRTMIKNADQRKKDLQNQHDNDRTFKMRNDPRVTALGRFLRRTSLDEMPQLWCVLKGQMSLVGPRPPTAEEVLKYTLEERQRLDIVPGLTCFWQVEGRSDLSFDQQIALDKQYIESQSVFVDLLILFKTIPAVILGKGAY